ncbi:MAG: BMC domain-containing protein [Cellulosilyticaceae bacterium]
MDNALGLIEVIGFVVAVEAADAALKAANVNLLGVTKVDGGIMTVQLTGDVGAIRSAVDAGGSAAERIGTVRAVHMIPRLDPAVARMLGHPTYSKGNAPIAEVSGSTQHIDDTAVVDLVPTVLEEPGEVEILEEIPSEETPDPSQTEEEIIREPQSSEELMEEVAIIEQIRPEAVKVFTREELEKISNQELKKLISVMGIKASAKKLKGAKKDDLIQMIIQFGKEGDIGGTDR